MSAPSFVPFERPHYDDVAIVPVHVVAVIAGSDFDGRSTSIVVTTTGEYRVFGDMGQVTGRLNNWAG
jgi:hypothetical protein